MKIRLSVAIVSWLCGAFYGVAPAHAANRVAIEAGRQQEIVTLSVLDAAPHKVFLVPDPDRLVVDVPAIAGREHITLPPDYRGRLIKALRFGQFTPQVSRFVFDLAQKVHVSEVRQEGRGQLRITLTPGASPEENPPVEPAASEPKQPVHYKQDVPQAPLKHAKPMIVIDAGHGGVDPGTIGPDGAYEKDLTLAYAQALKVKLLKTGRYRVRLTRENDTFIMLRKRVEIARKAGADMFISFHADSAPDMAARGLSVYTVSEKASDKESQALAARENKADVLAGVDLSDERDDVAGILISLAQRDTMNRSAALADILVTSLDGKVRLLQNSHRFAGFAVLKAPDIPSVLVEMGFLSHPNEEKLLKSKPYRDRVTANIAAGIDAYFRQQKRMGNL